MTRLDYESPQPSRRFRWAPKVAVVTSLAAVLSSAVSMFMFEFMQRSGAVQLVRRALSVVSFALAAAALVTTGLACFATPRGCGSRWPP